MAEQDQRRSADVGRDERVDTLGWGVLFVAVGAVSLIPGLPEGAWLVAAGLVMLGACGVRARLGLPVPGVTLAIGAVALTAGIGTVAGLATATGPLALIVLGLALVAGDIHQARRRPHGASLRMG